jgi:hypothetical protein
MKERCNECPASVHISDIEIEDEIRRVVESGVPLTERDQYEKRLNACNTCDQLVYATTCMSCGCIVKVRALNALRICPHVSGSRW